MRTLDEVPKNKSWVCQSFWLHAATFSSKNHSSADDSENLIGLLAHQQILTSITCRSSEVSVAKEELHQREHEHAEALQKLQQQLELEHTQLTSEAAKQQSLRALLKEAQLNAEAADSTAR